MGIDLSGAGAVATAVSNIFSLFKANPNIKIQGDIDLQQTELAGQLQQIIAQTQINAVEAASKSTFVAGWRPFIGWTCGGALAYTYIVQPFLTFIMAAIHHPVNLPAVSLTELLPIVFGMLGLGTLRTVEKVQGAAGNAAH